MHVTLYVGMTGKAFEVDGAVVLRYTCRDENEL